MEVLVVYIEVVVTPTFEVETVPEAVEPDPDTFKNK
jgi:hypothetical protein